MLLEDKIFSGASFPWVCISRKFPKKKTRLHLQRKNQPNFDAAISGIFFSLIMCCHGKMNCPNDIQASKMQNQPHVSSQLCQFCFQYLSLNPVIEILEIPGQAGCRRHRHNCDYIFMIMSDEPFAECLWGIPTLSYQVWRSDSESTNQGYTWLQ